MEQLGSTSLLHGTVGLDTPFEMVCNGPTKTASGDSVRLALPAEHIHCFDQDGLRL